MTERQLPVSLLPSATPPLAPKPNGSRIEITWEEAIAKSVEIQYRPVEMATKVYCVNSKSGYRLGHGYPLSLDAEGRVILTLRVGRWG